VYTAIKDTLWRKQSNKGQSEKVNIDNSVMQC